MLYGKHVSACSKYCYRYYGSAAGFLDTSAPVLSCHATALACTKRKQLVAAADTGSPRTTQALMVKMQFSSCMELVMCQILECDTVTV